jgi:Tol biopolymer transport system component
MKIRTTAAAQGLLYGFAALALSLQINARAQPLRLVSARDTSQALPSGGNGDSLGPILSPDGRYVLFASAANNLMLNSNSNPIATGMLPVFNVYLRDRTNGTTRLASINLAGDGGGNGNSSPAALSADGRYALFESLAGDLAAGTTNGLAQVFVRDLEAQATLLVSVDTNGAAANAACRGSTMTPDGRYVAFVSGASNLVAADTNGIPDVFVRDLQSGVTTLASVGAKATNANTIFIGSEAPAISDNGRYVVFFSIATNLVPGVGNGGEIYLRDTVAQTTAWVSGGARSLLGTSNVVSFNQTISADGAYIAFETATNLAMGSTNNGMILRYDVKSGLTDLVARNAYVQNANPDEIRSLATTYDGRFIAFVANTNSGNTCVMLWDAQAGTSVLVSGDLGGQVPTNSLCEWPSIDLTGRFVAFLSNGTNLVANPLTGGYHLYVRDTQAGTTLLADATTNGDGAPITFVAEPRLAAGGTVLAFESPDAPLVPNDSNHAFDVFLRDLTGGTTELVSAREPTLGSATPFGLSALSAFSTSPDGRFVAFTSTADDLAPGHTSGMRDVFVRDLLTETTVLASIGTNGAGADGVSSEPSISGDGRYVAFTSAADNLIASDPNHFKDVFMRDLQAGTTTLVSTNVGGTGPGNDISYAPVISADGRFLLFHSKATNLSTNTIPAGYDNLFQRDLQAGRTRALTISGAGSASMTPDGRLVAFVNAGRIYVWDSVVASVVETNFVPSSVGQLALSPQGDRVAFFAGTVPSLYILDRVSRSTNIVATGYPVGSWTGLRFSGNGGYLAYALALTNFGTSQVYLYDYQAQSNALVSHVFGSSVAASAASDMPDISADGRFVAYRSFATNLLASLASSNFPSVYVYDRLADASTLLSGATGNLPDNRSSKPIFAGDGRNLFFGSYASGLVPLDLNRSEDVFALGFLYAAISPPSVPGLGPTLTWPARPGETYHVQFKTTLSEAGWQEVTGTVVVTGNLASLTDMAPGLGERFYRVAVY